uniref:TIGR02206 family membrane protein n=1 Tax=Globodera pallida TaxID=36090 RepID=A0A183BPY0_GLOPA
MVVHWLRYVVFERLKEDKNDLSLKVEFIFMIISFLLGVVIIGWYIFFPSKQSCSLTAPIDSGIISVFYLFMPMFNDPLDICWDVGVQLGYHGYSVYLTVLVFSAAYLPYWFYVDFINGHKMLPYGLIAFTAYALFVLLFFFLGLPLDSMDLLLAMPLPFVAGTLFSLFNGTFSKLWKGQVKF